VITINCNACGKKLRIQDDYAGQPGQCPACYFTFPIPYPDGRVVEAPLTTQAVEITEPGPRPREEQPRQSEPQEEAPLPDHGNAALPAGVDFFAPAPSEIGPLRSAYTSLRQGQTPLSMGVRMLWASGAGGLGVVVGVIINAACGVTNPFWLFFWPAVIGLVAFAVTMAMTNFSHTCTYVGRDGVARFTCSGTRENLTVQEVFYFRDAVDLRTSTSLHYTNGAYQNTSYTYTWTDVSSRQRYTISGSHNSEANTPPTTDLYHYAKAAEIAWTVYLLEGASRQIGVGNTVLFNLTGGQWIRLGQGVVVINTGAQTEEWRADEMRGVTIQKGVVRLLRTDAEEGWFSSKGVHKFSFDQLANAQLFFHLMEHKVGVPVS
jgi:hypothetical protein